jgi:hypothetical protein
MIFYMISSFLIKLKLILMNKTKIIAIHHEEVSIDLIIYYILKQIKLRN